MQSAALRPEDLLSLNVVSDAQIAPGGDRVAYSISANGTPRAERNPVSRIWMRNLTASEPVQLTFGQSSDRHPRWSPDGFALSFLSDRVKRGRAQIYLLDQSIRDARQLTDLPAGVYDHSWSPTGDMVALTASDYVPDQENDVKLFDADRRYRRLYLCDTSTGAANPINHGDLHIWEYCWSPDGTRIAAIASDEPFEWGWYDAWLATIDVSTGNVETLYRPERQIARPAWSPDGSQIALITCRWSDPGMTGGDVFIVNVDDGRVRNLTAGEPRSHFTVHWRQDSSSLVTIGLESARAQICCVDSDSGSTSVWTGDSGLSDYGGTFDPASGRIALTISSPSAPPEVWTATIVPEGAPVQLQRLTCTNSPLETPPIELQWITWTSTDGRAIEGLYYSRSECSTGIAPPMVTLIHGGPTAAASASFPLAGAAAWIPFLLQQGIAVFMPNYRGSNGYGVEFAEANVGDLGGLDLQDVLSGIDACVRRGLADEQRLGIGGWSYGGYLTAWAITQTSRFAAAVAGASITNWFSFHGSTNIPGFDGQFIGAPVDELDSPYAWTSPLFFSKNVRTPALFVHGEQDPCCPYGQALEMTRAMRRRGVQAECAIYPREGHGFIEREHRRDMIERSVGWFRVHLEAL